MIVDESKVKQELTKQQDKIEQIKQTLNEAIKTSEYSKLFELNTKASNDESPNN